VAVDAGAAGRFWTSRRSNHRNPSDREGARPCPPPSSAIEPALIEPTRTRSSSNRCSRTSRQAAPAGIGYTALRLADGESFIHVIETTTADNPIADLDAFAAFQADIGDRLAAPPTAAEADVIGAYPIRANGAGHRPLTNDD
jgi:hypothetical protein